MNTPNSALAVIDGNLCLLTREGQRSGRYEPLASAVVEFRHGPMRVIVREHPYGLLPGIPNLYCLDGAFRLKWMAEMPDPADACTRIVSEDSATLVIETNSGTIARLDAETGKLLESSHQMAATA